MMGEWRYNDAQWKRLRLRILDRDGHVCQVRGPKCERVATVADHIVPVLDGGARYDGTNLRAACARCNTWRGNRQKAREGWRRSSTRIVLVAGPPGGGKSTYAKSQAGPRDVIIDYDVISEALGGGHDVATAARGAVLTKLRRGEVDAPTVWLISANPKAESMFPHHEVVVCDPGRDEVLRRCGAERPASFVGVVERWYAERTPKVSASRNWYG